MRIAFILFCFLIAQSISGQSLDSLSIVAQINLPAGVVCTSIDRQGNLYVADSAGTLRKYDGEGKILATFQARQVLLPDLLEAWNGLNVFLFFKQQRILYLDRFLTGNEPTPLPSTTASFVSMAAPSQDGRIWVWDTSDFSLSKIDNNTGSVIFNSPLNLVFKQAVEVCFMREYENRLYVADTAGYIHVFDNAGTYIQRSRPGVKWFSFTADNMVYLKSDTLFLQSLYGERLESWNYPQLSNTKYVMLTPKLIFAIIKKRLLILRRR